MREGQHRDKPATAWKLPAGYQRLHAQFGWDVPKHFNIAEVCCARWAGQPDATKRVAVHAWSTGASGTFYTYSQLQEQANRLSNVLLRLGVQKGDRVGIVMPQCFETAVAYMAVLQMGAVAMPLSMLFGPEALEFRLQDSEAVVAICDANALTSVQSARGHCPQLRHVIGVGAKDACDSHYAAALAKESAHFKPIATLADDPAVLIYTSGTTGNPKGALIPHRALIGNLTGFVASQNWFGFEPFASAS
ncbi:MAG: AMP-binding protein, partial [Pseudomonas fluorescens]|nr:AMP-binding protein [Pseudomonas fluorescens]